jgi:hypothetical protein
MEKPTPTETTAAQDIDDILAGNAPLISETEHDDILVEARARVREAMKDAERERLMAQAMERIRREEGQKTGEVDKDELVNVLIDVAEYAAVSNSSTGITVNGTQFQNGRTYQVPRHVAASLRDVMARSSEPQATIEGKPRHEYFRRANAKAISEATGVVSPWVEAG